MALFDYITDQFILKGINEGLSGNAIQTALTTAGLGVRRADLQARIRELSNVPIRASVLKYIPNNSYPSAASITEAGSYQARQYFYTIQINAIDTITGELKTYYQNISSDEELTAGEAKEAAEERLMKGQSGNKLNVQSSFLIIVQKQPS